MTSGAFDTTDGKGQQRGGHIQEDDVSKSTLNVVSVELSLGLSIQKRFVNALWHSWIIEAPTFMEPNRQTAIVPFYPGD